MGIGEGGLVREQQSVQVVPGREVEGWREIGGWGGIDSQDVEFVHRVIKILIWIEKRCMFRMQKKFGYTKND